MNKILAFKLFFFIHIFVDDENDDREKSNKQNKPKFIPESEIKEQENYSRFTGSAQNVNLIESSKHRILYLNLLLI